MVKNIEEGDKGMEREGRGKLCIYEIDLVLCVLIFCLEKENVFVIY